LDNIQASEIFSKIVMARLTSARPLFSRDSN
jgi:hypothetical protein